MVSLLTMIRWWSRVGKEDWSWSPWRVVAHSLRHSPPLQRKRGAVELSETIWKHSECKVAADCWDAQMFWVAKGLKRIQVLTCELGVWSLPLRLNIVNFLSDHQLLHSWDFQGLSCRLNNRMNWERVLQVRDKKKDNRLLLHPTRKQNDVHLHSKCIARTSTADWEIHTVPNPMLLTLSQQWRVCRQILIMTRVALSTSQPMCLLSLLASLYIFSSLPLFSSLSLSLSLLSSSSPSSLLSPLSLSSLLSLSSSPPLLLSSPPLLSFSSLSLFSLSSLLSLLSLSSLFSSLFSLLSFLFSLPLFSLLSSLFSLFFSLFSSLLSSSLLFSLLFSSLLFSSLLFSSLLFSSLLFSSLLFCGRCVVVCGVTRWNAHCTFKTSPCTSTTYKDVRRNGHWGEKRIHWCNKVSCNDKDSNDYQTKSCTSRGLDQNW